MEVSVAITKESQSRFYELLRETAKAMGQDVDKTIKFVAGTVNIGMQRATPRAKKKRKIVENPTGTTRWAIEGYDQTTAGSPGRRWLLPVGTRTSGKREFTHDVRREIYLRGLTRDVWKVAGRYARVSGGGSAKHAQSAAAATGKTERRGAYVVVTLSNSMPWIEMLDRGGPHNPPHHILVNGMVKGQDYLERRLTRMARAAAGRWS